MFQGHRSVQCPDKQGQYQAGFLRMEVIDDNGIYDGGTS